MRKLIENANIVQGIAPIDGTGSARVLRYVSLKNAANACIIIKAGVLTGNDTMNVTLVQATAVAATGEKALAFTEYWVSTANTDVFTKTTCVSTMPITSSDSGKTFVIEVPVESLDAANGFDCIQAQISSPGAHVALLDGTYILFNERFTALGTALTD